MYNIIGSFSIGAARIGVMDNMRLISRNASFAWGVHVNFSVFFISWYNGIAFSPSRLRNRLSEARQPVNLTKAHCRVVCADGLPGVLCNLHGASSMSSNVYLGFIWPCGFTFGFDFRLPPAAP